MFGRFVSSFKNPKNLGYVSKRFFDLHEYQAKDVMRKYNIRVQKGFLAQTAEEAEKVSHKLDPAGGLILKAQVHAGGRGKGTLSSGLKGGVKICKTPAEVAGFTKQMLGYKLVTKQTPKDGLEVKAVLVHEGVNIQKQIYLAFILDRASQKPAIIASTEGGVEIEEVAKDHPDAIITKPFDIEKGLSKTDALEVVRKLNIAPDQHEDAAQQILNLYKMFISLDATQIEINPWATDEAGKLWCIDAKINIDDSAKFRQAEIVNLRSQSVASEDADPDEVKAIDAGLNYVALDGNIGCMVNGAGLAMATMDVIKLHGGSPANFLDVGGGASLEQVKTAFEILTQHPQVKTILVNIFGGIVDCAMIANGVTQAAQIVGVKHPIVIRLTGTNAKGANEIINKFVKENTKYNITVANDLDDAAKKAVSKTEGR
jgi:succinyl-CoA synthetase beta subunit